jgi:hypothetical protein
LECHYAALIVLLQNQVAIGECVLFIDKVDHLLAIHFDDDVIALRDNVLIKPGVWWDEFLVDLDKVVKTAGPHRIFVGAIDLCFIALGAATLQVGNGDHLRKTQDRPVLPELPAPAIQQSRRRPSSTLRILI